MTISNLSYTINNTNNNYLYKYKDQLTNAFAANSDLSEGSAKL